MLKGLVYLKRSLQFALSILAKPFVWLLKLIFLPIFQGIYKIFLSIKLWLKKINLPFKNKLFYPLTSRYVIHVVLIIIALLITTTNISAKETRSENFGEKSILFALIQNSDELLIEEEVSAAGTPTTLSYLNNDSTISPISSQPQIDPGANGNITTVQGGSSLVKPVISTSATSPLARSEIVDYVIEPGDTISTIADKFGISTNTVLWANNLTIVSVIKPGNTLKILPTTGLVYKVAKNDTLSKIASTYGADKDKILAFNNIIDESLINQGDELIIPDGIMPKPVYTQKYAYQPQVKIAPLKDIFSSNPPEGVAPSGTKMQWPTSVYYISQKYSWRHTGLDIASKGNIPLYAAEDGVVIKSQGGWNGGYGNYIIIDHGDGVHTLYGHCSKLYVKVGETVKRGQTIAQMGSTGRSTGQHIHFEVRINGKRVNPLSYIR